MLDSGRVAAGLLLGVDAGQDQDKMAKEVASRWANFCEVAMGDTVVKDRARVDRELVFGHGAGGRCERPNCKDWYLYKAIAVRLAIDQRTYHLFSYNFLLLSCLIFPL